MSRLSVALFAALLLNTSASAQQTREQCLAVAQVVPEIWTAMNALDKKLGPVEWIPLVGATSGQFKLSVEATARAHANFMGALRQYKMAIEDLTYQAQLCAR